MITKNLLNKSHVDVYKEQSIGSKSEESVIKHTELLTNLISVFIHQNGTKHLTAMPVGYCSAVSIFDRALRSEIAP